MGTSTGHGIDGVMSRLPASGFTETPTEVFNWAVDAVALARGNLPGGPVQAQLWSYRHDGRQLLVLGFQDATETYHHSIVFTAGYPHNYDLLEPEVPDLAEALHMAGIVLEALEAPVEWLGRRGSEVNPAVLARPLGGGETNGPMKVARPHLADNFGYRTQPSKTESQEN